MLINKNEKERNAWIEKRKRQRCWTSSFRVSTSWYNIQSCAWILYVISESFFFFVDIYKSWTMSLRVLSNNQRKKNYWEEKWSRSYCGCCSISVCPPRWKSERRSRESRKGFKKNQPQSLINFSSLSWRMCTW